MSAATVETTQPQRSSASADRRIESIDLLRGAAVLGILPWNMQLYASVPAAFWNPYAGAFTDQTNVIVWTVMHVLIGYKDLAVFCMMFGAGLILLERKGESGPARRHYRRMFALLSIGLVHAYLIWPGDILVTFALCGMVIFLLRNLPPRWLIVLSAAFYCVPLILIFVVDAFIRVLPEATRAQVYLIHDPTAEQIAAHNAIYAGGLLDQLPARAVQSVQVQTLLFGAGFFWICGGMMLLGIALFHLRVLTAERSRSFYVKMMIGGAAAGLPLLVYGLVQNFQAGWEAEYSLLRGRFHSVAAAPLLALGWVGALTLVAMNGWLPWLRRRIQAAGRLSLSNYLFQSLVCWFVFYGHGLGMVGRMDRVEQLYLVLAIWAFQLAVSPWWVARFQLGPGEWLWRSLATWRWLPIRRSASTAL